MFDRDLVGVGLGPANLGLAIALEEAGTPARAQFLDRRPGFDWHPEMLLPSSVMQISYLKDLATQRDPRSAYTFVNYLHERGRMSDFINRKSFFPSRLEFTDYLRWAVERLQVPVCWGAEVVSVDLDERTGGCAVSWDLDGARHTTTTRYVAIGAGSTPRMPDWAAALPGVLHNTGLIGGLRSAGLGRGARVAVAGQGQSAAEAVRHVLDTYPGASVDCYLSGYGMTPADSSPFANRVFDPAAVDDFYFADANVRAELLDRHRATNYSCVDPELLTWLYDFEYQEKVAGGDRLRFHRAARITSARASGGRITLDVLRRMTGTTARETYDAVVCATGFTSPLPRKLLGGSFGDTSDVWLARDYRLHRADGSALPVFVLGSTESGHGLGSGLLSNIAVRGGEIAGQVIASARAPRRELAVIR
ncbi:putative peptide monooxygenase [Actinoplanes lobatus]|uniref:L-lysine N6-monooxygenase MbtG n=1 Tax=Actinoplanes lobatus TaxID=113568 RepID=A0A7W7HEK1_9ACTN|nr:SidA/IucD/PvdA family monooxygenase [Actinoplanes lobatus]MBB4748687.1 L-ornithine N5-oxygenase [Actinoplanes lobatus]GGN58441.1 putative peptide monooxygenase [Actinoplanes lobatus]GIE37411.1 putative peptide monooxygenase [Actinoplanes lobatus]